MRGMSLRTRLTLIVAAIVVLAVAGGASLAWLGTSRELHSQIDSFLLTRVAQYERAGPPDRRVGGDGSGFDRGPDRGRPLVELDAVTQVIDGSGTVVQSVAGQPSLPIDAKDIQLASSGGNVARLRDVTVSGQTYRMLTAADPRGGAVQLARSLEETDSVLHSLRDRLVLAALVGAAVAALIAWLVARGVVRPIAQLTRTAEHVAVTQDLSVPIPVRGDDEVGRLAASFNTMLVALSTSREQQKQLVADASHELRTPLTAVRTNIDLLLRATDLGPVERQELLDETRLELVELTTLVTELVDLATDARQEEPIEPVDLGDLAEDIAARYRRRTDHVINVEANGGDRVVEGRRAMLDRAVANLVDNAVKFSAAGSAVDIVVEGPVVSVLDRGPGVPEEDRARVFDRFYRSAATRTMPGSGLGLAIVSQIAELHGGTAELSARPGGGTVAVLRVG
jgi:two-component system sensor histidine kinase MprB